MITRDTKLTVGNLVFREISIFVLWETDQKDKFLKS